MSDLVSKIEKHIKKNASKVIIDRGKSISLDFDKKEENCFYFSYKGSSYNPYSIEASASETSISTKCNCPYDYGGLCKHEVAALNYIISDLDKKQHGIKLKDAQQKNLSMKKENKVDYSQIKLENHIISDELIDNLVKISGVGFVDDFNVDILSVTEDKTIKAVNNAFSVTNQSFSYNPEKQILTVKCSSKESKNSYSRQIISVLVAIKDLYGDDFFSPSYFKNKVIDFLKDYELTLEDNYQKYFDFGFDKNGFFYTEKVKNIFTNSDLFKESILPNLDEQDQTSLAILTQEKTQEAHTQGIGFCFEIDNYLIDHIYAFKFIVFLGKYKKHTKELATSFRALDYYNLGNFKELDNVCKSIVLDAVKVEEKNKEFFYQFSLDSFREAFIQLKEFVNNHKNDYSFFTKKIRPSLTRKNMLPIHFSDKPCELSFNLIETDDFFVLKIKIRVENQSYQSNSKKILVTPFFCVFENKDAYFFKSPKDFLYLQRFMGNPEVKFFKTDKKKFYDNVMHPISQHFRVENKIFKTEKNAEIANLDIKKQVFLSDYEGEYVVFKLGVDYGGKLILTHSNESFYNEKTEKIIERDNDFESEFIDNFKALHPDFENQEDVFYLKPQQLIENEWLLKTSQRLKQQDVAIFGVKDLKSFNFNLHQPVVSVGLKSDIDWFDLELEIKYGNQKVPLKDIRKALLKKSKYVQLKDGTLGVLPEKWLNKFEKYFKAGEVKNDTIKISNYQFNIVDDLYENIESTPDFLLELQRKKQQLQNLKDIESVVLPKTVKAKLRTYQQEGLNWLVFLKNNELGGCLADDMGLGKTLQTISLLAYLKHKKQLEEPSLIIAPTSLIFNWQKEIEKFAPSLKTLVYTGLKRKDSQKDFSKYTIILTTYGSVLNDIEFLQNQSFSYVILDESQAIKNPNSKRYKSVRLLKATYRLALTGTPIENNTFDLYAQMNFLNPGLLGSMSHFKTEFSDAIDKAKNQETSQLLHEIIHPFLLRRTKQQVATDLPEKIENIIYCEMGNSQRKVYDAFKDKFRDYLLDKFDENGESKSQMYVLEGLTKLRQICNSPQLLSEEEDYGNASIKLDILIDNLKTITSEGSKVLVFSQFTSMLALIQERLQTEDIVYEYLDGKTQNRQQKVNNFQENESINVFLISLKAGGTGLNLTKAEYVFLVDPWWNPAVENQAIDRCYRIGQTKKVIAYRMICKDTIEEKIVDLQTNKKQVSNSIIQVDTTTKSFDRAKIKELFS